MRCISVSSPSRREAVRCEQAKRARKKSISQSFLYRSLRCTEAPVFSGRRGRRFPPVTAPRRARALPLPWSLRADVGIGPYEPFCGSAVGAGPRPARMTPLRPFGAPPLKGRLLDCPFILHSAFPAFCILKYPSSVTASPCHLPLEGKALRVVGDADPLRCGTQSTIHSAFCISCILHSLSLFTLSEN